MKLKYIILVVSFLFVLAFVIMWNSRYNNELENTTYPTLERKGSLAKTAAWNERKITVNHLIENIVDNPKDFKSAIALSTIYIQEARITGNYTYYDKAAIKQVNNVLKLDPNNFHALVLKALLYLSQHHFADGLALAKKAQLVNSYNSFNYGILVDANVEMGDYVAAVGDADKMVSIRPDLSSYSRISYLREIHGDYRGAIEAMKLAISAGVPGDEETEWTRIQLGRLYENTGNLKDAEMQYMIALEERPGYAYGITGLARIATAFKDYSRAIAYYLQADSLIKDYSIKEELADTYKLEGENNKSNSISKIVIEEMSKDAQSGENNDNIGHYADRELAYAYLKLNRFDKALEHALAEYNRRPDNIDVNETIAWVHYCKGDFEKAIPYINVALKTGSKNPTLLCRAGLIYSKTANKASAKNLLRLALKDNANIALQLKADVINTLQNL